MTRYLGHQFGDYRLVRLLGTGGFAEVYEAEHLHLPGTKAAIKILKDAFTQKQLEELRKEALISSKVHHESKDGEERYSGDTLPLQFLADTPNTWRPEVFTQPH